jgi:hypothetical protein
MKIKILKSAYNDLQKGRNFYTAQGENIGEYFFDSLFSDIDSLVLYGGIHQKIFGFHRQLSHTFPYAIYYKIDHQENIIVYRILDCRQNPDTTEEILTRIEG